MVRGRGIGHVAARLVVPADTDSPLQDAPRGRRESEGSPTRFGYPITKTRSHLKITAQASASSSTCGMNPTATQFNTTESAAGNPRSSARWKGSRGSAPHAGKPYFEPWVLQRPSPPLRWKNWPPFPASDPIWRRESRRSSRAPLRSESPRPFGPTSLPFAHQRVDNGPLRHKNMIK